MKRKLLIILSFVTLFSCKSENQNVMKYNFNEDFKLYYYNTYKDSISSNLKFIIVIPLTSCTPCVDTTIDFVSKRKIKNCEVIFVNTEEIVLAINKKTQVDLIKSNYKTKTDSLSILYKYATNIGKPTLLILNSNKITEYMEFGENTISAVDDIIQNN